MQAPLVAVHVKNYETVRQAEPAHPLGIQSGRPPIVAYGTDHKIRRLMSMYIPNFHIRTECGHDLSMPSRLTPSNNTTLTDTRVPPGG
jgi:hypothetical protein